MAEKIDGNKLLIGYEKNFSEKGFWDKLKDAAVKAGAKAIYYALLLYYTAMADSTSLKDKVMIFSALGYFILPVDLIPDILPGGYADDMAALIACYKLVAKNITPAVEVEAKAKMNEWFGEDEIKKLM